MTFRRPIALLLILCLAIHSGESLVADVHDGDATAAELVWEGESSGVSAGATAAMRETRDGDGTSRGQPVHAQHACHCPHAHGFLNLVARPDAAPEVTDLSTPGADYARTPRELAREPQLRPPIVA